MLKRLIPPAVAVIAAALLVSDAHAYDVLQRSSETVKDYEQPVKTVKAFCPQGTVVLGGGGEVRDDGNDIARLTALVPVDSSPRDYYQALAETWFHGQYEPWSLRAYAICAPAEDVKEHRVFTGTQYNPNSATFVSGTAACQGDRVAYGAGGAISHPFANFNGRLGLQMIRTSNPLDIGRATAREDSSPHATPHAWWLTTYVVCAKEQSDVHVEGNGAPSGSLTATSYCDRAIHKVHGGGGGASGPGITDAGRSWLKTIAPSGDLRSVTTTMVGPDDPSGGVVAHHTCAGGS
jgi:hypothetical protein